jgi:hypothetical protein
MDSDEIVRSILEGNIPPHIYNLEANEVHRLLESNNYIYHPGDIFWMLEAFRFVPCTECKEFESKHEKKCTGLVNFNSSLGTIVSKSRIHDMGCLQYRASCTEDELKISDKEFERCGRLPRNLARAALQVESIRVFRYDTLSSSYELLWSEGEITDDSIHSQLPENATARPYKCVVQYRKLDQQDMSRCRMDPLFKDDSRFL